jgi:hypothetical protein
VEVDDASVVSPWSVDENVQQLINDGETAVSVSNFIIFIHICLLFQQTITEGTDLDLSELQHLANLPSDSEMMEYADLVDVQDLQDAASMGGSSIMSFIDWDQVNDLIADVH